MTTTSQGNKEITTRKIPATNNKILVRTGSLRFVKKYRQPIIKFWSVSVPVRETVRFFFIIYLILVGIQSSFIYCPLADY